MYIKKKGNMTPPKAHSSSKTKAKNSEMAERPQKEFKSLLLKMISD
jgi:hypothetical protein